MILQGYCVGRKAGGSEWMVAVWGSDTVVNASRKEKAKSKSLGWKRSSQEMKQWQRYSCQYMRRHTWNSTILTVANLLIIYSANNILLYISSKNSIFPVLFPLSCYGIEHAKRRIRWRRPSSCCLTLWKACSAEWPFLQKHKLCSDNSKWKITLKKKQVLSKYLVILAVK